MSDLDPTFTSWKPWFAWRPVKTMDKKWTWLRSVYRCELCATWAYRSQTYYGTIMDVLKYPALEGKYRKATVGQVPPKPPPPAPRPHG